MHIVLPRFSNCLEFTKTRHFKRQIQFSPQTPPSVDRTHRPSQQPSRLDASRRPVESSEVDACVRAVPVRSVQLMSETLDGSRAEMYADQRPVVFNESDVRRFRCVVNGSYPTPEVAVYVGDDDVTDQFVPDVELVRDGVPPYLRELYYRLQLTNDAFLIRHSSSPI